MFHEDWRCTLPSWSYIIVIRKSGLHCNCPSLGSIVLLDLIVGSVTGATLLFKDHPGCGVQGSIGKEKDYRMSVPQCLSTKRFCSPSHSRASTPAALCGNNAYLRGQAMLGPQWIK